MTSSPARLARAILLGLLFTASCGPPSAPPTSLEPSNAATAAPPASADPGASATVTASAAPAPAPAADDDAEPPVPKFAPPPAPGPAPERAPKTVRVAKIVKLAKAAASCKVSDHGYIERDCPAFVKWSDETALFENGKGDATVLSLIEDDNPRLREVALIKGFQRRDDLLSDKSNASRLLNAALREQDKIVAGHFGREVCRVDAEKTGLQGELYALAKHPLKELREALAFYLLPARVTPLNLDVAHRLMYDEDKRVQDNAVGSLSCGGVVKASPETCQLLGEQMKRRDAAGAEAHWAAATSWCKDLFPVLLTSLERRVGRLKSDDPFDTKYALAAQDSCHPRPDFDAATLASMRKRAFAIGEKIITFKETMHRVFGMDLLSRCDRAAARPILERLTKDPDRYVAEQARGFLK